MVWEEVSILREGEAVSRVDIISRLTTMEIISFITMEIISSITIGTASSVITMTSMIASSSGLVSPYYGYPYDYYPYDYGYYDYYGATSGDQYWSDLTATVQTELARTGYYHGAIDGAFGPDTARAVRAYRRAKGLPVTSQIDRGLLKSLNI
jgi:Putative peptidoglycan binding domain